MNSEEKSRLFKNNLFSLAASYFASRAVHVAALLGIADCLDSGAKSIAALAQELKLNESALYSLMRVLASRGIFLESTPKVFCHSDSSVFLSAKHPESLKSFIEIHCGESVRWQAAYAMDHTIKTGKPAFNHIFGMGYFDYISKHSDKADDFNESMAALSAKEDAGLAKTINFLGVGSVLDIGGGNGGLLCNILRNNNSLKGFLFDLPSVLDELDREDFTDNADRISFVSGSFFEAIPPSADLYLLKRVLHDWDDEQSVAILKNCAQAMSSSAKLLVIEGILPEGSEPHMLKDADMFMRVMFGGQERTLNEYKKLFAQAGLVFVEVEGSCEGMSIISAHLA